MHLFASNLASFDYFLKNVPILDEMSRDFVPLLVLDKLVEIL